MDEEDDTIDVLSFEVDGGDELSTKILKIGLISFFMITVNNINCNLTKPMRWSF